MYSRSIRLLPGCLFALALCACSHATSILPAPPAVPLLANDRTAKPAQYLYVYNAGSAGVTSGAYARYTVADLSLQGTTSATGIASHEVFTKSGVPSFIDEATHGSGFAAYLQPIGKGSVPAKQQFPGVPCQTASFAIGPNGHYYVAQYCSADVLEYSGGFSDKPKKPLATYRGGNLGQSGITNPTYILADRKGALYVGDNRSGVTYFPPGSKKGAVAFQAGSGGIVNQMVVDRKGDVWSIHGPNASAVYFANAKSCVPVSSGPIVRNEIGERLSDGKVVQHLYTTISTSPLFSDNGDSIAVDSKGRIYTGNQNADIKGVVLDFDPGASCPNVSLSFQVGRGATPQVAVDSARNLYVSNYNANTLAVYPEATTRAKKTLKQKKSLVAITYMTVGP